MPTRMMFKERRLERRKFADELATEREKRGDAGQLARLEANGHGHCQEAGKLRQKLDKIDPIEGELQEQTNHLDSLDRHLRKVVEERGAT